MSLRCVALPVAVAAVRNNVASTAGMRRLQLASLFAQVCSSWTVIVIVIVMIMIMIMMMMMIVDISVLS